MVLQEVQLEALHSDIHPVEILQKKAKLFGHDITEKEFAIQMDSSDPIRHLRQEFHYPKSMDLPEGKGPVIINARGDVRGRLFVH